VRGRVDKGFYIPLTPNISGAFAGSHVSPAFMFDWTFMISLLVEKQKN